MIRDWTAEERMEMRAGKRLRQRQIELRRAGCRRCRAEGSCHMATRPYEGDWQQDAGYAGYLKKSETRLRNYSLRKVY